MSEALTPENAMVRFVLASQLLHYFPDSRVVAHQINAAYMAGLDKVVLQALEARFKTVYPESYIEFKQGKPQEE